MALPGIGRDTALVVAAEVGRDLSRFPSSAHFCSWLDVAPPTRISGGKPPPGTRAQKPTTGSASPASDGGNANSTPCAAKPAAWVSSSFSTPRSPPRKSCLMEAGHTRDCAGAA